jgi:hypothetical protein
MNLEEIKGSMDECGGQSFMDECWRSKYQWMNLEVKVSIIKCLDGIFGEEFFKKSYSRLLVCSFRDGIF